MDCKSLLIATAVFGAFATMTACARTPDAAGDATVAQPPAASATAAVTAPARLPAAAGAPTMIVHKSASCGCCGLWVDHMRAAGFAVEVRDSDDLNPVKERVGVPYGKGSCHTAEVEGYFIEGHVPAADVKRLLAERPDAKGLVLPGMPLGSPGMESPDGRVQPYTVELVARDGEVSPYSAHSP